MGWLWAARSLNAAEPRPWTVARVWDEAALAAIRIDLPHPPVHARNLFHLSVAMYDAWAAYDPQAVGYLYHEKHVSADVAAARREAISYAAYRVLSERYALSRNAAKTLPVLDAHLEVLGYDRANRSLDPATPAGVGNRVAAALARYSVNDGALQSRGYQDLPVSQGGYVAVNPPLVTGTRGTLAVDVNRWQPLIITNAVSQNNIPVDQVQKFAGAQWLMVRPFALRRDAESLPWFDPGPPPRLGREGDAQFRSEVVEVIRRSRELTPDDGVELDISPGGFGNNSLGANDGVGRPLNPVTGQPYAPNRVRRGDFARVLAEFWADGPTSETPPGHWNVLANQMSEDPTQSHRLAGTGPVLEDLEWDVKLYFTLNAALHDAACAAWSLKRYYDGWRPIEAIRYMGQLGQSSDRNGPAYHRNGLPLEADLIEVTTVDSVKAGGRHAGLPAGLVAIRTWPGQPADPLHQHGGVRWIVAADWMPYQKANFVTPAFPGYISGHSTFSRAGAEVLAAFTGSEFFPGGLGQSTISTLSFEDGPTRPVTLQWASYYDAADQAGLSRIWGGIHVSADDLTGRRIGSRCGAAAWNLARTYFAGSLWRDGAVALSVRHVGGGGCEVSFPTVRGFSYRLESSDVLAGEFREDPQGLFQAVDTIKRFVEAPALPQKFYRVQITTEAGQPLAPIR